jgi:pilus assembly protein CpaB
MAVRVRAVRTVRIKPLTEAYREPLVLTAFTNALTSRVGILKGEQLTKSKVLDENTPLGLAWALAAGETAVALRLNAEQAVGGMINPGDRVNVLCTFDRQPGWEEAQTVEFLSRVRVLAVDGATTASSQRKDVSNEFVLVTLATTPQQSARIVLAGEKGRVSLALLSPLDARIAAAAPVGLRNFK